MVVRSFWLIESTPVTGILTGYAVGVSDLPPKTGPDVMLGSGRKLIRRRQDNIPLKTNWVKSKKNRGQNP